MGLHFDKVWNNGLHLTYHRIGGLNIVTNNENVIQVAAYMSKEDRDREVDYWEHPERFEDQDFGCYQEWYMISAPYDQAMTIESAYDYLKTLPEFEGATDI